MSQDANNSVNQALNAPSSPSAFPFAHFPMEQDVLWALNLIEAENELLSEEVPDATQTRTSPEPIQAFPEKVMQALQNNTMACAIGAKTPQPALNLLYWGLHRPLAPVLGTVGAVLMCPVCVYSSGLILLGMLWWGAKTPIPESEKRLT